MKKSQAFKIKSTILILLLTIGFQALAQDVIITTKGKKIDAKVEEVGTKKIKYKKFDNLKGPIYYIKKSEVSKIVFENGSEEIINISDELSLEETKAFIVENISKYGFEEDNFKQHYIASFEGDYLRLVFTNRKGNKPANKGFLYDFSNVYKFDRVSKRSEKLSYINIWTSIMVNEKKKKWDKHKLIMRVEKYKNALAIVKALKHYNKLLLELEE